MMFILGTSHSCNSNEFFNVKCFIFQYSNKRSIHQFRQDFVPGKEQIFSVNIDSRPRPRNPVIHHSTCKWCRQHSPIKYRANLPIIRSNNIQLDPWRVTTAFRRQCKLPLRQGLRKILIYDNDYSPMRGNFSPLEM